MYFILTNCKLMYRMIDSNIKINIKGAASMKKSSLIEKINSVIAEQNAKQENKKGEKVSENIKASDSEIKNNVLQQSTCLLYTYRCV